VLKQIRVQNFKVIEDTGLLPVQPLMAIIGRNGSGKSSLVEALDWLSLAVAEDAEAATEPFQRICDVINGWDEDPTRTFSITLVFDPQDTSLGTELVYRVEIGGDADGVVPQIVFEELSGEEREPGKQIFLIRTEQTTGARQYRIMPEDFGEFLWGTVSAPQQLALVNLRGSSNRAGMLLYDFLTCAVFLRLNPRTIASFAPQRVKPSPRLLDEEGARLAHLLSTFDDDLLTSLIEKLANILQRADRLETHRPTGPADRRFFSLTEQRGPDAPPLHVPAWTLSEGTRRITAILATLLADNPPPLLCIEEVENGLDPWTLKYLLDELAAAVFRGTQVLLTSHSPYLLNMLPLPVIMFCYRQSHSVEFAAGDQLPDLDVIQQRMGPGDLYANRYFHRSFEERSHEDRDSMRG
jgi:predicted ATPase